MLSFYRGQVELLQKLFSRPDVQLQQVNVSTVDGYQGRESDIVILSCVRQSEGVGFVADARRINVAMTRAKFALWVFGNMKHLAAYSTDWSSFFKHAKKQEVVISASGLSPP